MNDQLLAHLPALVGRSINLRLLPGVRHLLAPEGEYVIREVGMDRILGQVPSLVISQDPAVSLAVYANPMSPYTYLSSYGLEGNIRPILQAIETEHWQQARPSITALLDAVTLPDVLVRYMLRAL